MIGQPQPKPRDCIVAELNRKMDERKRLAPEVRKHAEMELNATQIGTSMSIRVKRVQMIAIENGITIGDQA